MSSGICARPDSSKKVRYDRKMQEDSVERQEKEVEIYESVDYIGNKDAEFWSHEGGLHTDRLPPAVQRSPFRAVAVVLGVLSFLMLTRIILFYIQFTSENEKLQRKYDQLSNNYTQLLEKNSDMAGDNSHLHSSYEALNKNYSQLQEEVKQLKQKGEDMAGDNSRLQSSYETLNKTYNQLQEEVKQLKQKLEVKQCPKGWERFGCSCYFKSSGKKSWYESRNNCKNRGADLLVINSKEEQDFVSELYMNAESWIGLWKEYTEWKWVDGSPLRVMFWAQESQASGQIQFAACCNQQRQWTENEYYQSKTWICER